jgi:hypothetical protein
MRAEALQRILHPPVSSSPSQSTAGSPLSASRAQAALRIRTGAEWEQARVPPAWSYRACAGRLIELSGTRAAPLLTLAFALVLDAQRAGEPVAWVQGAGSTFFPPDAARNGVDLRSLVVVRLPDRAGDPVQRQPAPGSLIQGYPAQSYPARSSPAPSHPAQTLARAAVRLLRSGAFGLIALDLTDLDGSGFDPGGSEHGGSEHGGSEHGGSEHGGSVPAAPNGNAARPAQWIPEREARISQALLGKLGQLVQQHDSVVCCLTVKRPERPSLGSLISLRGEAQRRRTGEDRFSCVLRVLKDKRGGPGWTHEEVAHGTPGLS